MTTVTGGIETRLAELEARVARLQELEDREAIREVLHRYVRACDRCDAELLKSCYWNDGYECHGGVFTGNSHEFAEHITGEMRTLSLVRHASTGEMIELQGDRAFVESQYTCHVVVGVPGVDAFIEQLALGRYMDMFEKRGGVWRIAHRHLVSDYNRRALITGQGDGRPQGGTAGTSNPDDPVYLGFDIGRIAQPFTRLSGVWDADREALRAMGSGQAD